MWASWAVAVVLALATGQWPGLTPGAEQFFAPLAALAPCIWPYAADCAPGTRVEHRRTRPLDVEVEDFLVTVMDRVPPDDAEFSSCRIILGCRTACRLAWNVECWAGGPSTEDPLPPFCDLTGLDRGSSWCMARAPEGD